MHGFFFVESLSIETFHSSPFLKLLSFVKPEKDRFEVGMDMFFFGEEAPSNEQSAAICFPTTFFLQEATLQIRFEIHGTGDSAGENFQNFWGAVSVSRFPLKNPRNLR